MKRKNGRLVNPERWVKLDKNGNPTGEEAEFDVIERPIERNGFMITYLSAIIAMIDKIGNKKMQVVKYILENMDSNNTLIKTLAEIEIDTKISSKTIWETLKLLEKSQIISRRTGVIMLSPKLIHKGNATKERMLLTKFYEIGNAETSVNPSKMPIEERKEEKGNEIFIGKDDAEIGEIIWNRMMEDKENRNSR